ncbi:hypothetical protein E4T44_03072 [Aureobasidium sp. EXF-8845]|nr:hypothetical protein E4T44_03072 [Aureobasidium sp. EXF-8845]KAI4855523.1 hypothetical protein E4T45_03031 [Aureobasidium sp. EXF-8846]
MVGKHIFVGCIAALSAVTYGQDDGEDDSTFDSVDDWTPSPPSMWGRLDTPFNFTTCAAPTEMETCWNAQNPDDAWENAGICDALRDRMKCALTNCWNRVYSCDYQQLVLSYDTSCSLENYFNDPRELTLPFFPAPAGAAESCSCDINQLNINLPDDDGHVECAEKERKGYGKDPYDEDEPSPNCDCCIYGAYAAAAWDTCKDQDAAYIILDYMKANWIDKKGSNNSLAQCPSRLENFNCMENGFSTYSYGMNATDYARPTPLHSATGTWSDINGILTAPVSGATYTWTAYNTTLTITAASVEAVATRIASSTAQTTTSGSGKDSGSMTSSFTGSATGSVTGTAIGASGTSAGAAPTLMAAQYPAAALMGLGGLAFALL